MVLVADKPSNYISILQTKFSDREGHEARRVGLEAMPLDQHIEGGHGEREVAYPPVADNVSRLLQVVCVMSLSQSSGLTSDFQSIVQPSSPACGHGFPALLHERFPG